MQCRDLAAACAAALTIAVAPATAGAATPASATASNDQELRIDIDTPADGATVATEVIPVGGTVALSAPTDTRVAYVVDGSGSSFDAKQLDCNGDGVFSTSDDLNADGRPGTIMDCQVAGLRALNASLAGTAGLDVGVVPFAESAVIADVAPTGGLQPFTTPGADRDTDGRKDVDEVVESIRPGGTVQWFTPFSIGVGTRYGVALQRTTELLGGHPGRKIAYFLSDGIPNDGTSGVTAAQQAAAAGIVVNTYAVGPAAGNCADTSVLRKVADITGGTCTVVSDPGGLADSLAVSLGPVLLAVGDTDANGVDTDFGQGGPGPVKVAGDDTPPGPVTHVPPPYRGEAAVGADGRFSGHVRLAYGPNLVKATASASDGTQVTASITVIRLREPTALAVEPAVARVISPGTRVTIGALEARLTTKGAPLAGRTVAFAAGGRALCQATTDANGVARCGNLTTSLQAVLGLGYDAAFGGDTAHQRSTGRGSLVVLGSLALLR